MKRVNVLIMMIMAAGLLMGGVYATAAPQATVREKELVGVTEQGYIGVRLDPNPLPPLLVRHLVLEEGQGILIDNVQVGSPADKAGLERDDIIIGFQEKPVRQYEEFVAQVQKYPAGSQVNLEIIQKGQRKMVQLTLAALTDDPQEWKYPLREQILPERGFDLDWPGRIFRLDPKQWGWEQIPLDRAPESLKDFLRQEQVQTVRVQDKENDYEITIYGDPAREDTRIVIRDFKEGTVMETGPGRIEKLPEPYRQWVKSALEGTGRTQRFEFRMDIPQIPPAERLPRALGDLRERLEQEIQRWRKEMGISREMDERLKQELDERLKRETEWFFDRLPRLEPQREGLELQMERFRDQIRRELQEIRVNQEQTLQRLRERLGMMEKSRQQLAERLERIETLIKEKIKTNQ